MAAKKIEILVTPEIERLMAERDKILNKNYYSTGDGDRLYHLQVQICAYMSDQCRRAL